MTPLTLTIALAGAIGIIATLIQPLIMYGLYKAAKGKRMLKVYNTPLRAFECLASSPGGGLKALCSLSWILWFVLILDPEWSLSDINNDGLTFFALVAMPISGTLSLITYALCLHALEKEFAPEKAVSIKNPKSVLKRALHLSSDLLIAVTVLASIIIFGIFNHD